MSAVSLVQFEDEDGQPVSSIIQVPNQIESTGLKSIINTTCDLYFNGRLISSTLEDALSEEQRDDTEDVKKIRLCKEMPASQPALYCASTYSGHEGPVLAVKLLDSLLITTGGDKTVRFWDMLTRTQKKIEQKHSHWVLCVDADDGMVVTGGMDKLVNLFDYEGNHLKSLGGHRDGVVGVRMVENKIISCGRDGICIVWNRDGSMAASWAHKSSIKSMGVDGSIIITGDKTGRIKVYKNMEYMCDLKGHSSQVNAVEVAGRYVVSGDDSGLVIVWRDWQPFRRIMHKGEVISLSISQNKQYFASGSFDRSVALWSLETGDKLGGYFHLGPVYRVKILSDLVMSASRDRTLKAYKVSACKVVSNLVADDEVYDFDYRDGVIVCGCRNGKVHFFQ